MPNKWTEHVKDWASKNKTSYKNALKDTACKTAYTANKMTGGNIDDPKMYKKAAKDVGKEVSKAFEPSTYKSVFGTKKRKSKSNTEDTPTVSEVEIEPPKIEPPKIEPPKQKRYLPEGTVTKFTIDDLEKVVGGKLAKMVSTKLLNNKINKMKNMVGGKVEKYSFEGADIDPEILAAQQAMQMEDDEEDEGFSELTESEEPVEEDEDVAEAQRLVVENFRSVFEHPAIVDTFTFQSYGTDLNTINPAYLDSFVLNYQMIFNNLYQMYPYTPIPVLTTEAARQSRLLIEAELANRFRQHLEAVSGRGLKRKVNKFIKGGELQSWVSPTAWSEYGKAIVKGRSDYPPKMRDIIKKYGDKQITSIYACRTPVPSILTSALNAVSFGEFSKKWDKQPYDKMFHLDIRVQLATSPPVTVLLEKNEVLNASVNPPPKSKNTECTFVPIEGKQLTITDLLEGARQIQGDKFFKYSAYDNNCQDYIMAVLRGSGIGTQENFDFVKQNTQELFKGLPGTRKTANTVTDLGAVFNTIIEGAGVQKGDNYYIQSIVFSKNKHDVPSSRKWLKDNKYVARSPDVTDTEIRWRQVNPKYIKDKGYTKFRTKKIGKNSGISLIIAYK